MFIAISYPYSIYAKRVTAQGMPDLFHTRKAIVVPVARSGEKKSRRSERRTEQTPEGYRMEETNAQQHGNMGGERPRDYIE